VTSISFYDEHAEVLTAQYQATEVAAVHGHWLDQLGDTPGYACDIGAGSGRDANWLAARGWDVIAVEPSQGLRERAMPGSHPGVTWLDDSLPELGHLRALERRFNLVLLSAVWQHLPPGEREEAFRALTELLSPGGTLLITLRHGSDEQENQRRGFYPVSAAEIEVFAQRHAITMHAPVRMTDQQRAHIQWETVRLRRV